MFFFNQFFNFIDVKYLGIFCKVETLIIHLINGNHCNGRGHDFYVYARISSIKRGLVVLVNIDPNGATIDGQNPFNKGFLDSTWSIQFGQLLLRSFHIFLSRVRLPCQSLFLLRELLLSACLQITEKNCTMIMQRS